MSSFYLASSSPFILANANSSSSLDGGSGLRVTVALLAAAVVPDWSAVMLVFLVATMMIDDDLIAKMMLECRWIVDATGD